MTMYYYPFHIGDFRSGTVNMSRHSRWIYRDMLDVYYDTEKPLTLDLDELCNEIGAESDEEHKIVEKLLRFKFIKTDLGYQHEICEKVIAEYHGKAETARANGKLGGRPKKENKNPEKPSGFQSGSNPVQLANPDLTGLKANQEPRTKNQEPRTNIKPLSISSTEVIEVFDHWCLVMASPKSKLDDKRRSLINKSLKLGYSVVDLKTAIDGCRQTPHNMGENERSTKYNGLDLIFRSADHIDRFIQTVRNGAINGQVRQGNNGYQQRDNSAAGRVAANIARERAERETTTARFAGEPLVANGSTVRPQMDQQLRGSSGPGECMGSVLEGDFSRAD